ncbi:MAG: hypothetical protein ACOCQQ_03565 [Candidatus Nanoarchaeia archaeon]
MKYKVAPLSGGFFLLSLLGFFTAIFLLSAISLNWAFIVGGISAMMFFAAIISVTAAPVEDELALDSPKSKRAERVKILSKKEYDARQKKKKTAKKQANKKKVRKTPSASGKKKAAKRTTKKSSDYSSRKKVSTKN